MAPLQIYDKLLQFPLFQGMSRDDLELVAGHTRLGFMKAAPGKTVISAGDACSHLYFLVSGSLRVETTANDGGYKVEEQMSAPYILQSEAIFGYRQSFTHTFVADQAASLISIDKDEVLRLSEDFLVFRLNLLNLFATHAQKLSRLFWRQPPQSLGERVVRFFAQHCVYPAGPKMFHILMNRLALEVNDSRLDVSRVLNQLQHEGKVVLHRGRVEIPQLERLLM